MFTMGESNYRINNEMRKIACGHFILIIFSFKSAWHLQKPTEILPPLSKLVYLPGQLSVLFFCHILATASLPWGIKINLDSFSLFKPSLHHLLLFISGLLELADSYCEDQLKEQCEQILMKTICVDNAIFLYSLATRYKAEVSQRVVEGKSTATRQVWEVLVVPFVGADAFVPWISRVLSPEKLQHQRFTQGDKSLTIMVCFHAWTGHHLWNSPCL